MSNSDKSGKLVVKGFSNRSALVLLLCACIAMLAVAILATLVGGHRDFFILIITPLLAQCLMDFLTSLEKRGLIKTNILEQKILYSVLYIAALLIIWFVAQNFVPKEITNNDLIALIALGLLAAIGSAKSFANIVLPPNDNVK